MKLIITESCIGPKGVHLEKGTQVEVAEEAHYVALIGHGKALSVESDKGKEAIEALTVAKLIGKTK